MNTAMEPTLVPGIIFSDTVIREEGTGKLSLIGTFQVFNAFRIPFQAQPFFATVEITNLRGILKDVKVCVRIEEADSGHVVASSTASLQTKQEVSHNQTFAIAFPIPMSIFPKAGIYQAVVLLNNEVIGRKNLIVRNVTASPEPEKNL
jgi:hypothetical protein